jgi:VIT1/CCC1 family predicted Fe2+/Mn2+ transporter
VTGPRHASGSRPGDRTVRAGALLFAVGGVGVLLTVLPYFFGEDDAPLAALVVASLMPFGLGLSLLGLLRGARASRREG